LGARLRTLSVARLEVLIRNVTNELVRRAREGEEYDPEQPVRAPKRARSKEPVPAGAKESGSS
jgi:hypothetical protein